MRRLRAAWISFLIEYHWFWIIRCRSRGERLLANGEQLSSPRLLSLTRKIDHHGMKAFYWQDAYDAIGMLS